MKGFTILELIINMLISSVIITLGYWSYHNLNSHYNNYIRTINEIETFERLNSEIVANISVCDKIVMIENNVIVFYKNDTVYKHFNPLIFKIDRFRLLGITSSYDNEQRKLGLLDEFEITISNSADTLTFHYFKKYNVLQSISNTDKTAEHE